MSGKGFIRIVEVVIFSYILFVLLVPTFFHHYEVNDWPEIQHYLLCNDMLYALEKNKTFDDVFNPFTPNMDFYSKYLENQEYLRNITEATFPIALDVNYEVKNVAPYKISIGCNCSASQVNWLKEKILTPSYPPVEYELGNTSLSDLSDFDYDVLLIMNSNSLSGYEPGITELLDEGKGVVLVRDFSSNPDSFTQQVFDISYLGGTSSNEDLGFENFSKTITSGISKRMIGNLIRVGTFGGSGTLYLKDSSYSVTVNSDNVVIQGCSGSIEEGGSCTLGDVEITLFMIDEFSNWIDLRLSGISNPREYNFNDEFLRSVGITNSTVLSYGSYSGANANVLEEYANSYATRPRTFWMYEFDRTRDDLSLLFKTGLIWASGEHFFVFEEDETVLGKSSTCQHFYSGLNGNNVPFVVKLYFYVY